jgi:hypothetical protein
MLICFSDIWNILQIFGILYDLFVQFVFIWYIFSGFGIMYLEKSGNPDFQGRPEQAFHLMGNDSLCYSLPEYRAKKNRAQSYDFEI